VILDADITAQIGGLELRARLEVRDGPLVLVGPNGAGQTSLLLAILGIIRPSAGRIALGCRGGAGRQQRRQRADQLLDELELRPVGARRPATLSGGERQRVALARALATEPRALLLDEPLAALDAGARRQVRSFVSSYLAKLDLPAIVVTHDLADAMALGRRIAVIERGQLVQTGTIDQLRAAPASAFVAALVAG
jgi:molybdate transport system ATP-binding protein